MKSFSRARFSGSPAHWRLVHFVADHSVELPVELPVEVAFYSPVLASNAPVQPTAEEEVG
jgi:hypothetical protein